MDTVRKRRKKNKYWIKMCTWCGCIMYIITYIYIHYIHYYSKLVRGSPIYINISMCMDMQ